MPRQWTSLHVPDGFELASAGRVRFRPDDLVKLAELILIIGNEDEDDHEEADNV